jgi:hypothetical protein
VPLQLGVPVLTLQASPQALQLLVVLSSVHVVPPHSVSLQVHVPALQSGFGCAHGVPLAQLPDAPHVCGTLPLQVTWPGAHEPWHAPVTHVWFTHGMFAPQLPFEQACTALPLHCVWPGPQTPRQTPPVHVWLTHGTGPLHVPVAVQLCVELPEHCV